MIQSIMPYHKERHIDMIIFTGDMVNMGGKSFDNIQQGFQTFKNLIIVPLVNALNLGKERFIFCPGNHDVDRMQDNKFAESGLTEQLNSSQSLDEFYEDPKSFEVMKGYWISKILKNNIMEKAPIYIINILISNLILNLI